MKTLMATLICIVCAFPALAENTLLVASGAGYKTVVEALAEGYAQRSGTTVERIYGNMGQIIGQAQTSGKVDVLIGEAGYLRSSSLPLADSTTLGEGRLVLAWPKGAHEPTDLKASSISRIAVPDPQRAIYGKAAAEYLRNSGQNEVLKDKLVTVGTVPQVFAYLSTGEVDAGFMNLTQAMAVGDKIGGYRIIDNTLHSPIAIVCIQLENAPKPQAARDFAEFLRSEPARAIITDHGL